MYLRCCLLHVTKLLTTGSAVFCDLAKEGTLRVEEPSLGLERHLSFADKYHATNTKHRGELVARVVVDEADRQILEEPRCRRVLWRPSSFRPHVALGGPAESAPFPPESAVPEETLAYASAPLSPKKGL